MHHNTKKSTRKTGSDIPVEPPNVGYDKSPSRTHNHHTRESAVAHHHHINITTGDYWPSYLATLGVPLQSSVTVDQRLRAPVITNNHQQNLLPNDPQYNHTPSITRPDPNTQPINIPTRTLCWPHIKDPYIRIDENIP